MNNVQILFGATGIKTAYEDSLKAEALDIICLSKNYPDIIGDFFDKTYAPKLYGSQIRTREILPDNKTNRADAVTKDPKNQVHFITNKITSESDLLITETKAVLISYDKESPLAVVITDQELVNNFRAQFEALWETLN